MVDKKETAEQIIIEVMRHFGYLRNYQVAEYFNVTPQTLSGWIKNGEIPLKHIIKFENEIKSNQRIDESKPLNIKNEISLDRSKDTPFESKVSIKKLQLLIKSNIKIFLWVPTSIFLLAFIYLFLIANPIYTSLSKVLPVSDDGSNSNGFSGMAAQLGINVPLSAGGKIPWDEIYPEIVKSNDLIVFLLNESFKTKKYGIKSLKDILTLEYKINGSNKIELETRIIEDLKEKINISKNRMSPIINLAVESFEPDLAVAISKKIIEESSKIQRRLKTNRIKQKRLFIEERLIEVSSELNLQEDRLTKFREKYRNESSPTLSMRVQEMGRDIDLQNSVYITLNSQYEKAKIDEVETENMVQLIDGPSLPIKLTSPKKGIGLVLSLFLGIFLSIFTVYIKENLIEYE